MFYSITDNPLKILILGFTLIVFIISLDLYHQKYQEIWNFLIRKVWSINYFSFLTWCFFAILFLFIIAFGIIIESYIVPQFLIISLYSNFWNFFNLMISLLLPFILMTLVIIQNSKKWFLESQKNPNRQKDEQIDHHAIIIASSTKKGKNLGLFVGSDLLIRYFIQNSIPYQVYLCCPKRADELIRNDTTRNLYFFGHGFHGGLVFHQNPEKIELKYDIFNDISVKKTIVQAHCNSGNEISLCEKQQLDLKGKRCFILRGIIDGINFAPDIWLNVKFKIIKFIIGNQNFSESE